LPLIEIGYTPTKQIVTTTDWKPPSFTKKKNNLVLVRIVHAHIWVWEEAL
jgi:hypothetical protein